MSGVFFYTVGIAFAVGVLFQSFFSFGWFDGAFLVLVGTALVMLVRMVAKSVPRWSVVFSIGLIAFTCGALRLTYEESRVSPFLAHEGATVSLSGVVVREPDVRERVVHLYVDPLEESDELVLVTTDRFAQVAYGDQIIAEGVLKKPEAFPTDLGRTFDYEGYLKARDVRYMIPFAEVSIVGSEEGNTLVALLLRGKEAFMTALERVLPEPHAGLGEGLLLGVKRAIGDDLEEVFRTAGVIHIVVLSGYNLMIVAECIMWLLAFVALPRTRLMVGVVMIVLFSLMVGVSATVARAAIMAILVLIARATGHTYVILRALMVAGVGMLFMNPYLLVYDPGFQLSFLATLGLIFLAPRIEEHLQGTVSPQLLIREFLVATLATQIMVLPLLLYLTGQFSLVSVIVNVLVLPLVPIAMLLTFISGMVGLLSTTLGTMVGLSAYVSLGYIIAIPTFFASAPFAALTIPTFPFWVAALMYALLGYGIYRWFKRGDETKEEQKLASEFDEWTIEEEIEKSPEAQSASGDHSPKLPFR